MTAVANDTDRERWLAERRTGLGGSDAAAALGLSRYKTPYQLYLEKRGEAVDEITNPSRVEWGNRLEDVIAQWYADDTGRRVFRVNEIQRHRDHPWMLASLDRRVVGEKRGLEIKTVDKDTARFSEEWGEAGTDEVPEAYVLQVQHYMAVTGWPVWDIAALVGGNEPRIYTVQRDEDLIAAMIERERAFWACVESSTPPPVTSIEEARQRFPVSQPRAIAATAEVAAACRALKTLKGAVKEYESEIERLQTTVLAHLGDADTLKYGDDILATWKSSKPSRKLDTKALADDHPEIIEAYTREFPGSRRFLLKGAAAE